MRYDLESINRRRENAKLTKKVFEIIIIILIYNVILIAISSANKMSIINILGYKSYIIKTNSMEPTIRINDVVISKKVKEEDIKIGDVITFLHDGAVITHRIIQIEEGDEIKYTTKGDNNNIEDTFKISYKNIEGKRILTIPYLGKLVEILENKLVFLIITLIVLILIFARVLNQEKIENRREKKKIEDEKRNKEAIE